MTADAAFEAPEQLAFLRKRVSQFGFWGFAMGLSFLGIRVLMEASVADHVDVRAEPGSWIAHGLATGFLGLTWLLTRRSQQSAQVVHAIEMAGIIGSCVAYAGMGLFMPAAWRPDWVVVLALANGMVLRAVIVPSSALRTLAISVALAPAVLWISYFHAPAIGSAWSPVLEPMLGQPIVLEQYAAQSVVWTGAWWMTATGICTATSHVVYGLRRQVSKAMRLGQYTLEDRLGEGGVGAVYRAHHALLRRPTAIKLLQPGRDGEVALARFEREVQLTAQLTHPNTVTIFDFGRTPEGLFYYAMELLNGATLAEIRAADGAQPVARILQIMFQVCGALAEAHGVGLIHRDVKPANIILAEQGGVPDVAKVVDFGLVKELRAPRDTTLTAHDTIVGTPMYMAPEAIQDPEAVDERSDLYALGAVGYVLLTDTELFDCSSVIELCSHHLHTVPEPPSRRLGRPVPPALEQLLLQCLAKDPSMRPASALELQQALEPLRAQYRWSVEQARSWWQRHQPTIDRQRSERLAAAPAPQARRLARALSPPHA